MKTISKIPIVFLMLFNMVNAFAASAPPLPTGKTANTNGVPPPDKVPIDSSLTILIIVALILGIYVIYRHKLYTKASI
jgi:hypothetical protein